MTTPTPTQPSTMAPSTMASETSQGVRYWRSLGELENTPEFQDILAREFPEGITEAPDDVSRRGFLGAVAASVALAGMTSCRKPETKILPFNKRPAGVKPGVPQVYATTLIRDGLGIGVLVKANDGRPTKVEGNPDHPSSLGGSDLRLQAELLQLYDPARSHAAANTHSRQHAGMAHGDHAHGGHGHGGHEVDVWEEFHSWFADASNDLAIKQGEGLHVLMPPTSSPSLLGQVARITGGAFPKARFHTWAPVHRDAAHEGARLAFGRPLTTHIDVGQADVILSLDSDFLATDGNSLRHAREWADRRREPEAGKQLSRLYVVESTFTTTGTAADHRFRTKSSEVPAVAFALAKALGVANGNELGQALASHDPGAFEKDGKKWLSVVARDLQAAKGRCVVLVGNHQSREVHAIVHAINSALGAVGKTVRYTEPADGLAGNVVDSIRAFTSALRDGSCSVAVFLGSNPAYDAPADLGFTAALQQSKAVKIHVGAYDDETARHCDWHFPMAHDLETWGDARAHDGTVSLQQPLVAPLHGGISSIEFLGLLNQESVGDGWEALLTARDTTFGYELVKQHWQQATGAADFETNWWPRALHDGLVPGTQLPAATATITPAPIAAAVRDWKRPSGMEVVLRACPKMHDGRYANNSWMAELPDPLTKLSWDNAAMISMATARQLNVENGDLLSIVSGEHQLQVPAWILPGHADNSVTLFLGWGRELGEHFRVAHGAGFNAYPLRTSTTQWVLTDAKVSRGQGRHTLVCTQEHGTMAGRALVREATASQNTSDSRWAQKMSPLDQAASLHGQTEKDVAKSLWVERYDARRADPEVKKSPYQWGMVIDLNACTGCSACVAACVAENNIPMVGKIQVARNREMFWIRADRYFSSRPGDELEMAEDPQVANMPVPCMQCENAPCESVCPVAATTHSPDGLNDMVYNRCIGTRYCSNNCPYKVRRYNYLDYLGHVPETKQMAFNPDVTVRFRGVMEKCTYCVQRINGGRIEAKLSSRKVGDGKNDVHVTTACAQACPTKAITFGNTIESTSKVAQLKSLDLNYGLLSELNTKPRTTYLGRVRNPHPELHNERA